jgi:serine/threonine protein kinase
MLVVCNHCQTTNRVPESAAGKKGKCPRCGAIIAIPAGAPPIEKAALPAAEPPEAAPPAAPTPAPADPSDAATVASNVPPGDQAATRPPEPGDELSPGAVNFSFLAPPQAPDELGRLGPYRILKVLGHGGMGVVFCAEDVGLGRQVAVKAMLPEVANKPAARERFLREARTAAAIEHDHIVPIYHVGEDRGVPYIAMPLLRGTSLEDWLRNQPPGPLPLPLILRLGRQMAEGLAAAHAHGLIHRDIKPANIWLESRARGSGGDSSPLMIEPGRLIDACRVKILDFGLARSSAGAQQLTLSGVIVGTPAYMAPEQARSGSKVDGRADLFSLGVVLYRLATGVLPFKGDDLMSTLMSVAMDRPVAPTGLNPELPLPISDLVMQLLEKDPKDRIGSAAAVVDMLKAIEEAPVVAPVIASEPPPVEEPPVAALAPPHAFEREPEAPPRRRRQREVDLDDDDDERDRPRIARGRNETTMSLVSMVLGIASAVVSLFGFCCCSYVGVPLGIVGGSAAIFLGVMGMKRGGKQYAVTGITLGVAALVLVFMAFVLTMTGLAANLINFNKFNF